MDAISDRIQGMGLISECGPAKTPTFGIDPMTTQKEAMSDLDRAARSAFGERARLVRYSFAYPGPYGTRYIGRHRAAVALCLGIPVRIGEGPTVTPPDALDPETLQALQDWKSEHGDRWARALRVAWMRASAPPPLHRLRNTLGPSWLDELENLLQSL